MQYFRLSILLCCLSMLSTNFAMHKKKKKFSKKEIIKFLQSQEHKENIIKDYLREHEQFLKEKDVFEELTKKSNFIIPGIENKFALSIE